MGLKCKVCGGELHPAEGAAICRCGLCGTIQPVPADDGADTVKTDPKEAAYLKAAALADSAASSADLLAAAEAFDLAEDFRDAKERADACRARAASLKEQEKEASFQKWLNEREEREKAKRDEERQRAEKQLEQEKEERERKLAEQQREAGRRKIRTFPAKFENGKVSQSEKEEPAAPEEEHRRVKIRRQARITEAQKKEKQQKEKRKKIFLIAAAVIFVAALAAGGYLMFGRKRPTEEKSTQTPLPVSSPQPGPADSPQPVPEEPTAVPEETPAAQNTPVPEPEANYLRAEQYLAEGNLEEAKKYFRLAAGYRDAAEKLKRISEYDSAETDYRNEDMVSAREKFRTLGGFLDAEAKYDEITEELYTQAVSALERKEYRLADELLTLLGDYKDCKTLVRNVENEYVTAQNHWQSGDKFVAEEEFLALSGWKDAGEKLTAIRMEIADDYAAAGDYDAALAYYEKLPFSDEAERKKTAARQAKNYQEAVAALESGNLEEARTKFVSAGGYRDADLQAADLKKYMQALEAMSAGKYEEARDLFAELGDYLDAAENLGACEKAIGQQSTAPDGSGGDGNTDEAKEAEYQAALDHLQKGETAEAEEILSRLSGWKDADAKLEEIREEIADRAAEAGDYETAIAYYGKLKKRTDETIAKLIAANKGKNYQDAMTALASGDTETAYAKLIAVSDFGDAEEQLARLNVYRRANTALAEGRYRDARADYASLGAYLDAEENLETCNDALYREAEELKNSGDSAGAYELFTLISGYKDSGDIAAGMNTDYQAALELIANGEKTEAEKLLAGMAGWKDADEKLAQLREEIAGQAMETGDYDTAIEYYGKLGGTSETAGDKLATAIQAKNYQEAMAALDSGELETAAEKLAAAGDFGDAADQLEKLTLYRKAEAALAEGLYRDARNDYISLGSYRDAADKLETCNDALYREAEELKRSGDGTGAYEIFTLISGYKDSGSIAAGMDADYQAAMDHIANGEKAEAEKLLAGLAGWKDTDGTLERIREEIADDAAAAGDYDTAIAYYDKLNSRTEATEAKLAAAIREKNYREATAALESGEPETARAKFAAAGDYLDAAEQAVRLDEYLKAESLKNSGAFDEAVQAFAGLGSYLDSAEQVNACLYAKAEAQLAGGDTDGAIETFQGIPDYQDSTDRANALRYEKAGAMRDSGDLQGARAAYAELGGYSDAPEMMMKVLDEMTDGLISAGKYGEALSAYLALEQTDEIREREYNLAQRCFDEGYYAEATEAYEALGQYELSLSKLPVARYAWAAQLFDAGDYGKAAEQFALLGDMSDSAERAKESIYRLAYSLMENGSCDEAKAYFASISGYKDADDQARECDYRKAASLYDAGEIRAAQELFESLGSYSDSRTRADICIYTQAEELFAAENYAEAKDLYGSVNYLDSAEKYGRCAYILADALYGEGRYAEAKDLYGSADYLDSREKAKDSAYREAEEYYSDGQFAEAEKCFLALGEYGDSADRAMDARLKQGSALMEAGDYEAALAFFEIADYGDSAMQAAKCRYELGYAAHAAGKPDEAIQQYARAMAVPEAGEAVMSAAKDYTAVKETEKAVQTLWLIRDRDEAKDYLMEIAAAEREAGENAIALLAYTSTGDSSLPEMREMLDEVPFGTFRELAQSCALLPDEKEYASQCIHVYAEALFGAGKYEESAAAFEAISGYADADEQAQESRYQYAKSLYDAGDYAAALPAYKAVKGYRDADELLATDTNLVREKQAPYVKAGNIVTFGSYEQDNDPSNGPEKIEWIVLESKNGKTLLLSRYGLDAKPYNSKNTRITWEKSSLRSWLNGEFLQTAFTAEEQSAVTAANVSNSKSQGYWSTSGGKDTTDRVFLLSYAEAHKYLGVTYKNSKNEKARTSPTAYAIAQGAEINRSILTNEGEPVGIWWLRSPGLSEQSAAHVHNGGSLYYRSVSSAYLMVRPAIVLDLSSDIF